MINMGIDAHKGACVAAVRGAAPEILGQAEFSNDPGGIAPSGARGAQVRGAGHQGRARVRGRLPGGAARHLGDRGIDTLLAHPAKTKAIAEARLKDDKAGPAILADLPRMDMVSESFVPDKHTGACAAPPGTG